jgi:hypothetical protein
MHVHCDKIIEICIKIFLTEIKMNTKRLLFYDSIRNDEIMKMASKITAAADCGQIDEETEDMYYELQRRLLYAVQTGYTEGTYWENYIYNLVAESENTFSLKAERGMLDDITAKLAEADIADIKEMLDVDWAGIAAHFDDGRECVCTLTPHVAEDGRASQIKAVFKNISDEQETLAEAVKALSDYYRKNFCGILGKYKAFVWDGVLTGVKNQDPVTFDDLIGYDFQQEQLIRNTEVFVKGRRSNNVLLYGDKGTGKSSSVKALLNKFGDSGLRMINVPKSRIFDIGDIMESVSGRGCRFIIFIDDLSFEDTETEYKHFKSVLEGGVEIQPENVLLYVTSNRRNLVKETWKDRNDTDGEVHISDGIHERQSLADRFGLKLTFSAPDKELYTEIVRSIAKKQNLKIDDEKLLAEANKWDMRQTSRSGRSAKQFVTHMAGMDE